MDRYFEAGICSKAGGIAQVAARLAETAALALARPTANRSPRAAFREVPGDDLHAVG